LAASGFVAAGLAVSAGFDVAAPKSPPAVEVAAAGAAVVVAAGVAADEAGTAV
jgi:hypothetical protein